MNATINLDDVKYADVVVVGQIMNYKIVRDHEFRRRMLSNPNLSPNMRELYEGPGGLISDYARFDVQIDEVLVGKAPTTLSVTWDNSTFEEPEKMATGPFLIALRDPKSPTPPLRGPSAYVGPNPDPTALTVLQAPCSSPFIFESTSDETRTVRSILAAQPR
jgi:hypothetical protein